MGRIENKAVFEDTRELCKNNVVIKRAVQASTAGQKLILENDIISKSEKERFDEDVKIVVSKKRTFEAASDYSDMRVAVHNFASASNPGGGVVNGANAQEECLCRCSGLYFSLNTKEMWDGFYQPHRDTHDPLHNDDIIYTPDVLVFKTDTSEPKLLPEDKWYKVDVVTCAAPNLRREPSNIYNIGDGRESAVLSKEELYNLHVKRLKRILDVAANEGAEVVVLGAFGCGAFRNDPRVVAKASADVIAEYKRAFKVIEFAIYCGKNGEGNYMAFKETITED